MRTEPETGDMGHRSLGFFEHIRTTPKEEQNLGRTEKREYEMVRVLERWSWDLHSAAGLVHERNCLLTLFRSFECVGSL